MTVTILSLLSVCLLAAVFCVMTGGKGNSILHGLHGRQCSATKERGGKSRAEKTEVFDYSGLTTKNLLVAALQHLNCKVENDGERDDKIYFNYQAENFCAIASNDCLMVTLYDFSWGAVDLDDIDEVSILRKAINEVNLYTPVSLVYSIDKESKKMVVHTKRQILMIPQIPDIEKYLMAMLASFFEVQRSLVHELDNLREGKADK